MQCILQDLVKSHKGKGKGNILTISHLTVFLPNPFGIRGKLWGRKNGRAEEPNKYSFLSILVCFRHASSLLSL